MVHWQADSICGIRAHTVEREESAVNAGKFSMSDQPFVQAGDTVAIASDHAGFSLKETLRQDLAELGFNVLDLGTDSDASVDYPDFGKSIANAVADGTAKAGVAICGTGIGISIAANRVPAVRAALVHSVQTAEMARDHNDANIMALGARVIDKDTARACLKTFFETPFGSGERHERRVAKLGAA